MCLEAHYICMVKHDIQHTALVSIEYLEIIKFVLPCSDSG